MRPIRATRNSKVMPYYKDGIAIVKDGPYASHFELVYSPETQVRQPGIYQCTVCHYEIVCIVGQTFPPATDKGHDDWGCYGASLVKWQLIVRTLDRKPAPL